ncbi:NADP-specific glutamate dehydrogenase [Lysinibacillus irui]|uniref:Glutamate dehydrogenase n=1 Tax=Lysinibacillus irui TaxID=2998077 RepID=A0AAJ5RXV5_9BACI|nr:MULTISPECIES: NADP-specific glutamate dehydrogenase [Lysinibacillus]MEA0552314.1 NADP-specific glutamate dehydrogenase [Lysinibacillus irui]MEA0565336.1 NADP-specific glutamate dehydrogenase [Lysinibacillus irui]MEA0977446.1 NADP-specific glutamate dehydrogenase [Lysinibacillus irui]MEA1043600.1 NADP-specific glutamate dehydrogenase [Lysinibacillus irui]WDV08344.1 NADP-specific glutamate dehydrogenase [Lysinibacillus irui]
MTITTVSNEQLAKEYVDGVFEQLKQQNCHQAEFLQAAEEIFISLVPVFAQHPEYIQANILSRIVEPDRIISFRVAWQDDNNQVQVNRGYRVQYSNVMGPYKGGLRFHPSVNESIIKFLGFEQIFKNALTGQPIGGGKGGSNFDPKGKSDSEIMRFCQAFMTELYRHIGPDVDVPAGDIGVGAREVGYLWGQYKRLTKANESGVLTGKTPGYGGSLARKEATGYGTVYFVNEMLKDANDSFEGKTVVVSGSGNVSTYAIEKAQQYGAKVVACSDSSGYIYDPEGLDLAAIKEIKEVKGDRISTYVNYRPNATFTEGCTGIWTIPCDIALPCATQNEINGESARTLISNGVKAIGEGANMPSDLEAINEFLNAGVLFGPAKAANAGGVAVSALEMAQDSSRVFWSFEEVDAKLHQIMKNIYMDSKAAAEKYGFPGNLVMGANIAGFIKVADGMLMEGVY